MFRFRVLGGFSLEGPSGVALRALPRRRAEAVLAVLAVSGDLGCTRERLVALLWPESDEAHSRQGLRDTLRTIRQALGSNAVLSAGDRLHLDSTIVNSDLSSFSQALARGLDADAVQAYSGALLEGFHVDDAPEYERWLDGERTRLAREYGEALERLATAAEGAGAWGEAASWWAQAEEHDPLNTHLVLRHAEALAAIGDRANAIRLADAHVRRLREELELVPDRDVLARMERIRRGEVTAPQEGGAHLLSGSPAERPQMAREPPAPPHPPATLTPGTAFPQTPPLGAVRSRRLAVAASALGAGGLLVAIGLLAGLLVTAKRSAIPLDATAIAVLPFQVVGADSATAARTLARHMGDLFELKVRAEFGRRIRHPGSVAARWREAGGTLDSALVEETELSVARAVGAGRLVRGTVMAIGDSLVVSASMLDVTTGAVRVAPVRVEGTLARQQELVDRLIILLLARDAGVSPASAPQLTQYKPDAIQAYLAASGAAEFSREQKGFLHAALAADSNLVDAAVELYAWGEGDTTALRYAWEHRDQLTERSRAYLQVLAAGRYGSIRTESERVAAYEALARRWPEWDGPWGDVGDQLTNWGALASVPDWQRRAREALERVDRRADWMLWHLAELAFMDDDTARARAAIDSLAPRKAIPRLASAYRWRLAMLTGDTAQAAQTLSHQPRIDMVLQFALADGRGPVHLLDQVAVDRNPLAAMWAWSRGHERAWRDAWRKYGSPAGEISQATVPVFWALLLGPSEDTMAVQAVRSLEQMAEGRHIPRISADDQALARCWIALWRLRHGDTTGARATRRWLEGDVDRRYRFAGWARLIDVLVTEAAGGDVHAALLRMDSVMRDLPLPTGSLLWDPTPPEVQNLILARMLRRYGEPERALAAARRRIYRAVMNYPDALPEYLREEGRLAALVGDTAGAIHAYRHYLVLRENPDPPWRASWDSVRVELGALVAR